MRARSHALTLGCDPVRGQQSRDTTANTHSRGAHSQPLTQLHSLRIAVHMRAWMRWVSTSGATRTASERGPLEAFTQRRDAMPMHTHTVAWHATAKHCKDSHARVTMQRLNERRNCVKCSQLTHTHTLTISAGSVHRLPRSHLRLLHTAPVQQP